MDAPAAAQGAGRPGLGSVREEVWAARPGGRGCRGPLWPEAAAPRELPVSGPEGPLGAQNAIGRRKGKLRPGGEKACAGSHTAS